MQLKFAKLSALSTGWGLEAATAVAALTAGLGILPLLIFFAGSFLLGRYEDASAARLYGSIYRGLGEGSLVSWAIVIGPYALYLIFRGLRLWWRASADLAGAQAPR